MHGARTEYARTHWRRLLAGGGALDETCSHQRQMTKLGHIRAVVEGAQARLSSPYKATSLLRDVVFAAPASAVNMDILHFNRLDERPRTGREGANGEEAVAMAAFTPV